jgi:hypothetical protein
MAVDVDVNEGLRDLVSTVALKVDDLLTRDVAAEVFVADGAQVLPRQAKAQAAKELEDLLTTCLAETSLEPVARTPTIRVTSFPDPSENSLFRRNPGCFTYIH